jgi:two-component system LytT family response regulator
MQKMTCLIIDDEQPSRDNLKAILTEYCPNIHIIGEAANASDATQLIHNLKPELLFLDVEMGTDNGLQLLKSFVNPNFEVIFITAYDVYAVKAFKTIASDYLLKPLDLDELQTAIQKISDKIALRKQMLSNQLTVPQPKIEEKLKVTTSDGTELIPFSQILYLQSINYYTNIVLLSGREIITSRHLKDYETILSSGPFFRLHNSFIVNAEKIRHLVHAEGGQVILTNGKTIKISRRRKESFIQFLDNFPGLVK